MTIKEMSLSEKQIADAQRIINSTPPGDYELKQIYGADWSQITSPTTFGKFFKKAVEDGQLTGIKIKELRSDNHYVYSIGAEF